MEWSAIPLAFIAGILSLISPCVLPMLPAVTASAMQASRAGLWALTLGIMLAFALAGTVLTFVLLSLGLSPDILRQFSVVILLLMALVLLLPALNDRLAWGLSRLTCRFAHSPIEGQSVAAQALIGLSLGLVWLPCVGPTLGTAIALASTGQHMGMAFLVMLSFGAGTALPLVWIGYHSGIKLAKLRTSAVIGKKLLGVTLLVLGLLILTGFDRVLEAWALELLPDWVTSI
jgi:cytochrome c biogenesis protein CcdA